MNKTCNHRVDFAMAEIVGWVDDWCDLGVVCVRCGEEGSASVTPDDIKWNDEDGGGKRTQTQERSASYSASTERRLRIVRRSSPSAN